MLLVPKKLSPKSNIAKSNVYRVIASFSQYRERSCIDDLILTNKKVSKFTRQAQPLSNVKCFVICIDVETFGKMNFCDY